MRQTFIILGLLFLILPKLQAQSNYDFYWPYAIDWDLDIPGVQAFEFDFNERPFEPTLRDSELSMGQNNASICDADGNLLMYFNGCAIANGEHQIMPNGTGINAGPFFDDFWERRCDRGYPGAQDVIILPDPGNVDGYYVIHLPRSYNPDNPDPNFRFTADSLQFSYVDLSLDNGLGEVTEKNVTFFNGSILGAYLTAVTHDNGLDWWLIKPVFPSGFLVHSVTDAGLELASIQPGPTWDVLYSSAGGFSRFSPDGKMYASFSEFDGLYLYDFDRTDGSLSHERHVPFRDDGETFGNGIGFNSCEWSPNSRFIYLGASDTLWQVDTWAEPLADGVEFIASRNPTAPDQILPNPRFSVLALGPDCRIYVRGRSSSFEMHIIHNPDEKGQACNFQQRAIELPFPTSAGSFPNFPRFRVDEEDKCDPSIVSAFGEVVYYRRDLVTYPNPVRNDLTIELPEGVGDGMLYVIDMQGQMVHSQEVSVLTGSMQLSMLSLPVGMYAVEYVPRENKERVVYTSRVARVE